MACNPHADRSHHPAPTLSQRGVVSKAMPKAAPRAMPKAVTSMVGQDTYWEGLYPPSSVLGPILSKAPSGLLGVVSGLFLGIGLYSAQANDLSSLPVVHWEYVVGANLLPISWGLHVASWIQKENGK